MGDDNHWGVDFSLPLHLQINKPRLPKKWTKQRKDAIDRKVEFGPGMNRQFVKRGLKLSGGELRSLLAGRTLGIKTLDRVLSRTPIAQELAPDERLSLAADLADTLMDMSLEAQLSREAPTALELNQQRDEVLQHVLLGKLAKEFPVKAQLTIHFPVSWL